jgi:hypothetical protein
VCKGPYFKLEVPVISGEGSGYSLKVKFIINFQTLNININKGGIMELIGYIVIGFLLGQMIGFIWCRWFQ